VAMRTTPVKERTIRNSEIFFDAADSRRFGKDVFFQSAHTANDLGREWVRRELAAQGTRVQDFHFESHFHFSHIDARLTPVDEGLCFFSSMDKPTPDMIQLFKENEWSILDGGTREDCRCTADQCAPGIHLNVLTIAPKVCIVEKNEKSLIKLFSEEGVDVIPIEFSACYPFGGALNCYTLDIHRQGPAQKSYFPTLDVKAEREEAKQMLSEKP
ncbi:strB1, partial [Symbiodinium pilosum]